MTYYQFSPIFIFVVVWLLLRIIGELEGWSGPRGPVYPVVRLVTLLVGLILVLVGGPIR